MNLFKKASSFLNEFVPEDIAKKGLEKLSPKIRNAFNKASKLGYPTGAVLGVLRNWTKHGQKKDRNLRPDELAESELKEQRESPQRFIKKGLDVASSAGLGGLVGQAAVNAAGSLFDSGDKNQTSQANEEMAESSHPQQESYDRATAFEQQHPKLMSFLDKQTDQGIPLEQAVQRARGVKALQDEIMQAEKASNMDLLSLLNYILSSGKQSSQKVPNQNQQQPSKGMSDLLQALQAVKGMRGG